MVKPTDRRRAFLDPAPRSTAQPVAMPIHVRFGHLPNRVHLRRGFRLRGRLVRFAAHRRRSASR